MLAFSNQAAMRGFFYGPNMPEITELKLSLDLSKGVDAVQVLKALSEASLVAAEGLKAANTEAESSALLLRAQAEQARDATAAAKALGAFNANEAKSMADAFKLVSGLGNAYTRLAALRAAGGAGAKYAAFASEEQRDTNLETAGKTAADAKAKEKAAPAAPKRNYSEAEWKEAAEFAVVFGKKLEQAFGNVGSTIGKVT